MRIKSWRGWAIVSWACASAAVAAFANAFLSRKAFLGAPAEGEQGTAKIEVRVTEPGRYLALVRYEAAYRFETQFRVKVEPGNDSPTDLPGRLADSALRRSSDTVLLKP
jgi:hypothetical protein